MTSDDGPFSETKKVSDLGVHINHFFNGLNYGCIYDKANVKRMRASFDAGSEFFCWSSLSSAIFFPLLTVPSGFSLSQTPSELTLGDTSI